MESLDISGISTTISRNQDRPGGRPSGPEQGRSHILKNLRKPLMMGAVALVSIGGLAGCEYGPDHPGNPDNFPPRAQMLKDGSTWYGIIAPKWNGERSWCREISGGTRDPNVRWDAANSRWSVNMACFYRVNPNTNSNGSSLRGDPGNVQAHADWTKDWITGSIFQS